MVKSGFLRKMAISLSLAALGAGLSSCGLKNWWGEKPKGAPVINAFSNGSTCPEPMRILKGTEEQSSEAFECVATQLGQLWTQIEGEKKDTLSDDEIRLLVNRNVIAIEGDKAGKLHRLFEAKRLLGFGPSLERAKVEELLAFLRENRATLRAAYRKFIAREGRILYTDVRAAGNLLAALLRRLDWRMTSDELNRALQVFVEVRDPEIRDALLPTADFGINFLNMTCPQFVRKDFWNTRELADCAIALLEHFKGGAAWFEFLLNPVEDFSVGQGYEIANALKRLRGDFEIATGKGEKGLIQKWFGDP
ncbi:MAG: hypothetical protein NDJ89_02695, partial [Oligoflexia bacterium]|nr:hypothetical protein [Oligoflexia bacterium]